MNSFQSIFKPLKFDFWAFLFSSAIKRLLIKICGELKNVFDIVYVCLSVREIIIKMEKDSNTAYVSEALMFRVADNIMIFILLVLLDRSIRYHNICNSYQLIKNSPGQI